MEAVVGNARDGATDECAAPDLVHNNVLQELQAVWLKCPINLLISAICVLLVVRGVMLDGLLPQDLVEAPE
jgi:hypothetical protein